MSAVSRPRRSMLYMPGSNVRALEKAKTLAADALILDLEDAVAPDTKGQARTTIKTALTGGGYGRREILVRINGLNTPWGLDDIAAMAGCGADGLLLPKVESADMVRQVSELMTAQGAPDSMRLWCMLETPRAALRAEEIAGADPRLGGLIMGTSDLAKELNCAHTPQRLPMVTALGLCLLAARASRLPILDGVFLDIADSAGFKDACAQGREFGFDGKTLIHPSQIDAANDAFGPSPQELDWARRVIAAHESATATGQGVVLLDGRLVENLHVDMARHTIALADDITALAAGLPSE